MLAEAALKKKIVSGSTLKVAAPAPQHCMAQLDTSAHPNTRIRYRYPLKRSPKNTLFENSPFLCEFRDVGFSILQLLLCESGRRNDEDQAKLCGTDPEPTHFDATNSKQQTMY